MNYYRMLISYCLNVHWIKDGYESYYRFRCDCKIQCPLMAYCKEKNWSKNNGVRVWWKNLAVKRTSAEIDKEDENHIGVVLRGQESY